ncbi:MAG: MarR family transcriptional regulator [Solirubrobacteraceae bacterium]
MATEITFTPQVLGEAEKALNAILVRELAGPGLSEHQWITLQLVTAAGGAVARDELVGRLDGALKRGMPDAQARVDELLAAGLLQSAEPDGQVRVTETGREVHARVRDSVTAITQRLWGDLPGDDLAATGRTLATILARANAEFVTAGAADER